MRLEKLLIIFLVISQFISIGFSQDSNAEIIKAKKLRNEIKSGNSEISNYNTACYFALEGDPDLAFLYLKEAIYKDGFNNYDIMEKDSDFKSLHQKPLWPILLDEVRKNAEKTSKLFINQPDFWESNAFQKPFEKDLSENEKIAGLSKFWSEAKYNFVNFDLIPDLNFDSLYISYLPKVKDTKSTLEYYYTMAEFCAKLRDSHTNIFPPEELFDSVYARPLIRSRLIEDKVLIVAIGDHVLESKGLRVGQEILEVNGLPVKEYAERYIIPYTSASTKQDLNIRAYDYALFSGSINEPIQLKLRDSKGKITLQIIYRVKPEVRTEKFKVPPFEFKMLKDSIAYVAMNSFGNDSAEKSFISQFDKISKSKAIIIDIRNNGGGSTPWGILRYLINQPHLIHSWYTREYKPAFRAWGWSQKTYGGKTSLNPINGFNYDKPIIILTSSITFSAAEDFAAAFKSLGRGVIIGEPTGGSTGMPLMINLLGNLKARICTKRDMMGNGEDFVGKGVFPDIMKAPTVSDIRNGVDSQLDVALKELKRIVQN